MSADAAMSGLGITFEAPTLAQDDYDAPYHSPYRGHPALAPHLNRTLQHSVSYDEGLNRHLYLKQKAMIRQASEDSTGSGGQKRVRIAVGTPEVFGGKEANYHYQPHNLSPLSDFDTSSASDTNSSQPFSPASLSDLPSSTESGAYPTFYAQAPAPLLDHLSHHEPTAPGMESAQSRPYPPVISSLHPGQPPRPSRLPAFLQERQRAGGGLARPQSMMELSQAYARPTAALRGPRAEEQHLEYSHYESSPDAEAVAVRPNLTQFSPESIPSSAGGLQRRHLERELAEQKQLLEEERRRLRTSDLRPREPAQPSEDFRRAPPRHRSRSMSVQGLQQLAQVEAAEQRHLRRSQSHGFLQDVQGTRDEEDEQESVISLENRPLGGPASVTRQNTLLTAGASTVRRRKELNRLLAPSSKKGSAGLPSITGSPTPSAASSAVTASTRIPPSSRASTAVPTIPSPVCLEQSKGTSRARVELDLMLETPLVVEGGTLKGKLELRVRKPKDKEGEVWIGKPKVRVIGFEELASNDARYIFFHHAESISSISSPTAPSLNLPCFDTHPDGEGYCRAKLGQHTIPVRMTLPVGKGAKGPWKGKQGVVRYIAIASVKLKSKAGADRSIAHFYRHVEVFPYFNPALALAPAIKPLEAEAAKSLFLGGSGKVSLKASMHRETWVAGQRCYVDVRVENESSKKVRLSLPRRLSQPYLPSFFLQIKTLTLALIRTTSIHRPGTDGAPSQSQTTRKKIAETTLEMGKKGTKGVTAKGSWVGVDAGESADFSHSLLVPSDALSIPRGRHVEISYLVKVSVSGSLSADVAADIPIRILNFVSLDPPPGHTGASPVVEQQAQPMARTWSSNTLKSQAPTVQKRQGPLMNRMVSIDSLRLEDLNGGRGPSRLGRPTLSRVASADSVRTGTLSPALGIEEDLLNHSPLLSGDRDSLRPTDARPDAPVGRALQRQLQHQMSIDCISSAIASATARRQGLERQPSFLRSGTRSADDHRWEEEEHGGIEVELQSPEDSGNHLYYGGGMLPGEGVYAGDCVEIQLDDLDDIPDDPAFLDQHHSPAEAPADAESDDELETIMQSHFSEDEGAEAEEETPSYALKPAPPSPRQRAQQPPPPSPTRGSRPRTSSSPMKPSSPVKASPSQDSLRSAGRRSPDKFAFATPASPIKANAETPKMATPRAADFPSPPVRTSRPLPTPPADSVPLIKHPSGSSLRRNPSILRKTPSTRSLRSVSSSVELSRVYPAGIALPPSRSPSLASPKVSPILATVRTRSTMSPSLAAPSSPRKVLTAPSPALRATRSMADLSHRSPSSPSTEMRSPSSHRKSSILPSVKTKVAALETRKATLSTLATTSGRAKIPTAQLARVDSVVSTASTVTSESSFKLSDLTRANSVASFKAPLLKRNYSGAPPLPPLPASQ
ncbi:hypothetical protein JCM11641_003571 [Rhodosporidiobolus odoratus]